MKSRHRCWSRQRHAAGGCVRQFVCAVAYATHPAAGRPVPCRPEAVRLINSRRNWTDDGMRCGRRQCKSTSVTCGACRPVSNLARFCVQSCVYCWLYDTIQRLQNKLHSYKTAHRENVLVRCPITGRATAGIKTRSSATAKSTARPSCLVGIHYHIYRKTINRSTAYKPLLRNWPRKLPNSAK